jgi:hypothetical protein
MNKSFARRTGAAQRRSFYARAMRHWRSYLKRQGLSDMPEPDDRVCLSGDCTVTLPSGYRGEPLAEFKVDHRGRLRPMPLRFMRSWEGEFEVSQERKWRQQVQEDMARAQVSA